MLVGEKAPQFGAVIFRAFSGRSADHLDTEMMNVVIGSGESRCTSPRRPATLLQLAPTTVARKNRSASLVSTGGTPATARRSHDIRRRPQIILVFRAANRLDACCCTNICSGHGVSPDNRRRRNYINGDRTAQPKTPKTHSASAQENPLMKLHRRRQHAFVAE
jgi:hypothetical protein